MNTENSQGSTYLKNGSLQPGFDADAPEWLKEYNRQRVTLKNNTPASIISFYLHLREFFQWASVYKETGQHPKDEKSLRATSINTLPFSAAKEITRGDIEQYLFFLHLTLHNGASSRNTKLVAVRTFYSYLIDKELMEVNPAERIKVAKQEKKQPIFLAGNEQDAFLGAIAPSDPNYDRDYALFLLMLTTGIRISEAVGINMRDINMDERTIQIRGKGRKERMAHLSVPCRNAIRQYIQNYRELILPLDTDALWVSKRNKERLTTRAVEKTMKKYIKKAGLNPDFTPHKLRHTTATILAKDTTISLLVIQQMLGHESSATTEIYTHIDSNDVGEAVDASRLALLGVPIKSD